MLFFPNCLALTVCVCVSMPSFVCSRAKGSKDKYKIIIIIIIIGSHCLSKRQNGRKERTDGRSNGQSFVRSVGRERNQIANSACLLALRAHIIRVILLSPGNTNVWWSRNTNKWAIISLVLYHFWRHKAKKNGSEKTKHKQANQNRHKPLSLSLSLSIS